MTDAEFIYKLQSVLIEMSEIWYEPQWESLNEKLWVQQSGYITCTDLEMAQDAFLLAEQIMNPTDPQLNIVDRVEQWKLEREKM